MSARHREESAMFAPELLDIASAGDGAGVASSRPWSSLQSRNSRAARAQAARVFELRMLAVKNSMKRWLAFAPAALTAAGRAGRLARADS